MYATPALERAGVLHFRRLSGVACRPRAATVPAVKTSASKPSVGCNRAGFTFVDPDGRLVQLYWEDLQSAGEALFCFDGVSWKRVRNVSSFMRRADADVTLRFAVAPLEATESVLRERSVKFPAGLLLGDGADRVLRVRELLALPRPMVEGSELWASLSETEQSVISSMRYARTGDLSDTDILAALSTGARHDFSAKEIFESEVKALLGASPGVPAPRDLFGYGDLPNISAALAAGKVDASDFLALFAASSARSLGMVGIGSVRPAADDILALLVEFSDAPDPVAAVLSSVYAIPAGPRQHMLLAFDMLSNGAAAPEDAFAVAGRLLERGLTSASAVDLAALSLLRSGSATGLDEVLDAYATDPVAAVRRFGSPETVLHQKLPELPALQRAAMLELLGVPASTVPTEEDLAALDRFDPELFLRVSALLSDATGSQYDGNVDFAVRVISVFGERAPEWLLKNASSPALDRARLLDRLPDAATAATRVRQLAEVLDAPAPTEQERVEAATAAQALGGIVDALRRRERGEFLSSLATSLEGDGSGARNALRQISDGEELLGFFLDSDRLLAKLTDHPELDEQSHRALVSIASLMGSDRQAAASAARKFLAAGGDPSMLLRFASEELRDQSDALLRPATDDVLLGFKAVADRDDLLLSLLPTSAAANKRLKSLDDDSVAEKEFLAAYAALLKAGDLSAAAALARRAFDDPALLRVVLPPAKQAGQRLDALKPVLESEAERASRMAGLRKDYESWTRYSEAILSGDQDELVAVGADLFPDRDPSRISVHDALYWLPANPRATVAPDGSSLGEWLLDADRGSSALRTETGRRSLGLAAESWASNGARSAVIKDLSDAVLAAGFGGYRDELSLFFVSNKISKKSAQVSLDTMRTSKDTPTLLPLDRVFEDASTGIRGYFLPRTDPRGMQAGVFTDCCQHPDSAGASCALAGQTHPSSGFFVVEDASGQILAQSWVWAADGTAESAPGVIFDNVEARLSGADASRVAAVRQVYDAAADVLATRFGRVMIGAGNDVPMTDLPLVETSENLLAASIGYSGYLGDSSRQRLYRTGSVSGPRFLGAEGGFRVIEGSSEVFVAADGSVRLDGPDARGLAERALASSTLRTYKVVDASGVETGEVFDTGTVPTYALSLDLDAAPSSYDRFSAEVLSLTGELTGLPEEDCAAWLRITGGDPKIAARTFGSGLTIEEYSQVAYAVGRVGRVPSFPPLISDGSLSQEDGAKTRAAFLRFWAQEPNTAERLFSSAVTATTVVDLLSSGGALTSVRDRVLVENVLAASPLLPARSPEERINLLRATVEVHSAADKAGNSSNVRGLALIRAVEDAMRLGLSSGDIEALTRLAPEFGSREGVALLDRASREKFASLGWEEQSEVRSVIDYTLRDARSVRADLAFALELAAEPDRSLRYAAVRNSPAGCDPRDTLSFLQQVPFVEDSPIPEIRQSFADPATDKSDVRVSVASRYAAAQRYVYDRSDSPALTVEETAELIATDFDSLVENCRALDMEVSYGENIMPYSFPARSIPILASKSTAELREVASVVSLTRRYGSDLAAAVESGLTVEHLVAVTPPGEEPQLFDSSKIGDALRAGVTPEEIRSFARPGVSMDMFNALLESERLRTAFRSSEDPEVTERVIAATGGPVDGQVLDLVYDLAARDPETRREVLELFTPPTPDSAEVTDDFYYDEYEARRRSRVFMPDVHVRLAELAGLAERLGGFRPRTTTRW